MEEPTQPKKNNFKNKIKKIPKGYFVLSTSILAIALVLVSFFEIGIGITGGTIGVKVDQDLGQKIIDYLNTQTGGGVKLVEINEEESYIEIIVSYNGQNIPVHTTKDGKYLIQGIAPLDEMPEAQSTEKEQPTFQMHECTEKYNISNDTIIFYYSDQCGWCSKMKPGIEQLEKEGYSIKWIKAGDEEDSQIINECVRDYMTSGGIPQFICPKTNEIKTGAFTDESRELDQVALREWADNCIQ